MKWVFAFIGALALATPAFAQSVISSAEFRDGYIAALREADPTLKIEVVDDATVKFGRGDPLEFSTYLDRAYRDYRDDPAEKNKLINDLVRVNIRLASGDIDAPASDRLIAMLRPLNYAPGVADAGKDNPISRPFAGDLRVYLMMDNPETLSSVSREMLANLKLSEDQAFTLALKNLPGRLGELYIETMDDFRYVNAESGLAVATLVAPSACTTDKSSQRLVFVADRSYFLEADMSNTAGVAAVRKVARGMIRDGVSMSATLLRCSGGAWSAVPIR